MKLKFLHFFLNKSYFLKYQSLNIMELFKSLLFLQHISKYQSLKSLSEISMANVQVNKISVKVNCQGHNRKTYRVCTIGQLFIGDTITNAFKIYAIKQIGKHFFYNLMFYFK